MSHEHGEAAVPDVLEVGSEESSSSDDSSSSGSESSSSSSSSGSSSNSSSSSEEKPDCRCEQDAFGLASNPKCVWRCAGAFVSEEDDRAPYLLLISTSLSGRQMQRPVALRVSAKGTLAQVVNSPVFEYRLRFERCKKGDKPSPGFYTIAAILDEPKRIDGGVKKNRHAKLARWLSACYLEWPGTSTNYCPTDVAELKEARSLPSWAEDPLETAAILARRCAYRKSGHPHLLLPKAGPKAGTTLLSTLLEEKPVCYRNTDKALVAEACTGPLSDLYEDIHCSRRRQWLFDDAELKERVFAKAEFPLNAEDDAIVPLAAYTSISDVRLVERLAKVESSTDLPPIREVFPFFNRCGEGALLASLPNLEPAAARQYALQLLTKRLRAEAKKTLKWTRSTAIVVRTLYERVRAAALWALGEQGFQRPWLDEVIALSGGLFVPHPLRDGLSYIAVRGLQTCQDEESLFDLVSKHWERLEIITLDAENSGGRTPLVKLASLYTDAGALTTTIVTPYDRDARRSALALAAKVPHRSAKERASPAYVCLSESVVNDVNAQLSTTEGAARCRTVIIEAAHLFDTKPLHRILTRLVGDSRVTKIVIVGSIFICGSRVGAPFRDAVARRAPPDPSTPGHLTLELALKQWKPHEDVALLHTFRSPAIDGTWKCCEFRRDLDDLRSFSHKYGSKTRVMCLMLWKTLLALSDAELLYTLSHGYPLLVRDTPFGIKSEDQLLDVLLEARKKREWEPRGRTTVAGLLCV